MYSQNFLVAAISFLVGLLIIEGLTRLIYDPINFFKPELIQDPILRHKLAPDSGGHDEWGYRNKEVPDSVRVVAIGDSQTYGASADSEDSWPHQLGKLLEGTVYNLALGGYGPVQYAYMLENQGLKLKPKTVIAGFYLGNDLYDAYFMAYRQEYWKSLRDTSIEHTLQDTSKLYDVSFSAPASSFSIRKWLADNSMVYNIVFIHSFIGDYIRGQRNADKVQDDQSLTMLKDDTANISATFTPAMRLYALDLKDPKIKEGLRISLNRLQRMDSICKSKGIDFQVLIIPTKETVYAPYLEKNEQLRNYNIVRELLENEREATDITKKFFEYNGIKYIEVTEILRASIKDDIYPNDSDGHPNKKGYKLIAQRVLVDNDNK